MNTATPSSPRPPLDPFQGFAIAWRRALFTTARFAGSQGRSTRTEFWSFHIITFILLSFFLAIPGVHFFLDALLMIFVLIASTSVSVRRLHDIGRSGWWIFWVFVSFAVPLAIWLISWASALFAASTIAAAISFLFPIVEILLLNSRFNSEIFRDFILASMPGIVMTITIAIMCLTDGDPETNKYGPNPKLNPTDPNNPI